MSINTQLSKIKRTSSDFNNNISFTGVFLTVNGDIIHIDYWERLGWIALIDDYRGYKCELTLTTKDEILDMTAHNHKQFFLFPDQYVQFALLPLATWSEIDVNDTPPLIIPDLNRDRYDGNEMGVLSIPSLNEDDDTHHTGFLLQPRSNEENTG